MTIDIRLKTGQLKLAFVILLALSLGLITYSAIEKIEKNLITFIIGIVLFLVYLFLLLKKLHYFYYNDDKNKVIIRFYQAHPLIRTFKAFEIPKNIIKGYEIKETLLGLRKSLIINVENNRKSGEYPPVSISLLSKKEIETLEKALNSLIKK